MKQSLFRVVALLFWNQIVFAQSWTELRSEVARGVYMPRLDGFFNKPITHGFGSFVWFQVQPNYAEAYGGGSYSPRSWVGFGLGVGLENVGNNVRIGSYMWLAKGSLSALSVFEGRGTGFWYKNETNWQSKSGVGLGSLLELGKGLRPRLQYIVPGSHLSFWLSPLFSHHGRLTVIITVRWTM